jgi:hypothetical protein
MSTTPLALWLLIQEARALLTRLDLVKPFALQETMVPAAASPLAAQVAIERYLLGGRRELRQMVTEYLHWLQSPAGRVAPVSEAQRRFAFLRMRFNTVLSQFDVFSDVITQRSERETGVWLAGLDVVAADALAFPGPYYESPPVICYVDRGYGAAIRRARTRLPGGGENPVAIIRVPRERMVGNGIASSLVHEVGHQGAALLDLVNSLRQPLSRLQRSHNGTANVWSLYNRWISEILADFWSVARVGVCSTLGLMAVVSLPRAFVFRTGLDDPHPIPWIRVKLSCAMGKALYPHPQWEKVDSIWESYYPLAGLRGDKRQLLTTIEASIPDFVALLVNHRPASLRGRSLGEVLAAADRQPERLRARYEAWRAAPAQMHRASPTLVFAAIGQARVDGKLTPEAESRLLSGLLTYWAMRNALDTSAICAAQTQAPAAALIT